MRITIPPARGADSTPRFLTYRYYLRSLAGLAGLAHPSVDLNGIYPTLAARIGAMPSCRPARSSRPFDQHALKRSLTNAWATELLLSLSGEYAVEDELLRITNNWAAVQLYYVFYHVTQALIVARGDTRPDEHSRTKLIYMDMWASRSLDCAPWTLGYKEGPINVPPGHVVDGHVTTVVRPRSEGDFLNYTFKALSTTRNEALPTALKSHREVKRKADKVEWEKAEADRIREGRRARKQPRFALPTLTDEEKAAARGRVRCHTIMDLLWRLRTRTNYADGLMFIEGPLDDEGSSELNLDMRNLASATMLFYELHICKLVGADAMRGLMSGWLDRNRVGSATGVSQRMPLVLA